uniref:Uncharacterized protein n=1 Tax=Arundo donax TaxID=35708 RepID=A0A0A8ZRP5_ARUDO
MLRRIKFVILNGIRVKSIRVICINNIFFIQKCQLSKFQYFYLFLLLLILQYKNKQNIRNSCVILLVSILF